MLRCQIYFLGVIHMVFIQINIDLIVNNRNLQDMWPNYRPDYKLDLISLCMYMYFN